MIKRTISSIALSALMTIPAYASPSCPGSWNGTFTFLDSQNSEQVAVHTPSRIRVMFITSRVFTFSKGAKLNNVIAKENGILANYQDVETFKSELSKLGEITGSEIEELDCPES